MLPYHTCIRYQSMVGVINRQAFAPKDIEYSHTISEQHGRNACRTQGTLALKARMAFSRFLCWERSLWLRATSPVGRWVSRTALSVVLTCCPPAPCERMVSTFRSLAGISTAAAAPEAQGTRNARPVSEKVMP